LLAQWRITALGSEALMQESRCRLVRNSPSTHITPDIVATALSELVADFSKEVAQSVLLKVE